MNNIGRGGDAGDIFVAARNIEGSGSFEARGGDGSVGGKGGNVTLITDNNQFSGIIDVQGGRSVNQEQELERPWYKSWWMEYVVYPLLVGVVLIVLGFIFSKFLK